MSNWPPFFWCDKLSNEKTLRFFSHMRQIIEHRHVSAVNNLKITRNEQPVIGTGKSEMTENKCSLSNGKLEKSTVYENFEGVLDMIMVE